MLLTSILSSANNELLAVTASTRVLVTMLMSGASTSALNMRTVDASTDPSIALQWNKHMKL